MRFAVVHCPNPSCRLKVWVPSNKLGVEGKCPNCGHAMKTPATVPADELQEGPSVIAQNDTAGDRLVGLTQSHS